MTTTIIEQLAALTEKAPEVCKIIHLSESGPHYQIGEYVFWEHRIYGFSAYLATGPLNPVTGRSALAWLVDALASECERRGWYWEVHYYPPRQKFQAEITNKTVWSATAVEALLAAFLAAVEGEQ